MNSWIYLIIAGIFEILWVLLMKLSNNFTKVTPTIGTIFFMGLSIYFLSYSLKGIPMGTGYACWTAIGAVGTVIVGILLFNESVSYLKVFFIFLVIFGIIGLKLTTV